MNDVLKLLPADAMHAIEYMIEHGITGQLTFHFNKGMVQQIERREFSRVHART